MTKEELIERCMAEFEIAKKLGLKETNWLPFKQAWYRAYDLGTKKVKLKCEGCKFLNGHVLTPDEAGGGNYFEYCQKGHWEGGEPDFTKPDPWKDCIDFESTKIE